jgi:hypothetical protein
VHSTTIESAALVALESNPFVSIDADCPLVVHELYGRLRIETAEHLFTALCEFAAYNIVQGRTPDCSILSWLIYLREVDFQLYVNMIACLVCRGEMTLDFRTLSGDIVTHTMPLVLPQSRNEELGPPLFEVLLLTLASYCGMQTLACDSAALLARRLEMPEDALNQFAGTLVEHYGRIVGYHSLCLADMSTFPIDLFLCSIFQSPVHPIDVLLAFKALSIDLNERSIVVSVTNRETGDVSSISFACAAPEEDVSPVVLMCSVVTANADSLHDNPVILDILRASATLFCSQFPEESAVAQRLAVAFGRIFSGDDGALELRKQFLLAVFCWDLASIDRPDELEQSILFDATFPGFELAAQMACVRTVYVLSGPCAGNAMYYAPLYFHLPVLLYGKGYTDEEISEEVKNTSNNPALMAISASFTIDATTPYLLVQSLIECGTVFNLPFGSILMVDLCDRNEGCHSCCVKILSDELDVGVEYPIILTQLKHEEPSLRRMQKLIAEFKEIAMAGGEAALVDRINGHPKGPHSLDQSISLDVLSPEVLADADCPFYPDGADFIHRFYEWLNELTPEELLAIADDKRPICYYLIVLEDGKFHIRAGTLLAELECYLGERPFADEYEITIHNPLFCIPTLRDVA